MSKRVLRLCALLLVSLATLPAIAAEGRTPVFLPGTFLGVDGKYIVTRNLLGGVGPVITIGAPNVDLDLNGMVLTNLGAGSPVISVMGGADHVTIRNGFLSSGTVGIEAMGPTRKIDIEDVEIHDMGGATGQGIHLGDVEGAAIRRVEVTDTTGDGILWDGPGMIKHGTIEDGLFRRTAGGIVVANQCSSVGILNNRLEEPGGSGGAGAFGPFGIALINCSASLVAENTVERASADGIFLRSGKGNKLFDNVVTTSAGNGINLDSGTLDTLLLNNVTTGNGTGGFASGGSGLFIQGGQNYLEGNLSNSNAGVGLHFCGPAACGNDFSETMARGNTGAVFPIFCGGCPALGAGAFGPNSCNTGAACGVPNTSSGGNLIPGPPVL